MGAFVCSVGACAALAMLAPPERRRSVLVSLGLALFVFFFWPTPYETRSQGGAFVKVSRITGQRR